MKAELTGPQPAPEMLDLAHRLAGFMVDRDWARLDQIFFPEGVTILENFPPYLFEGRRAGQAWAEAFCAYARDLSDLVYAFGPAENVSRSGPRQYFTLPTRWTGCVSGVEFTERGGWQFLLQQHHGVWRLRGYGWAVTEVHSPRTMDGPAG